MPSMRAPAGGGSRAARSCQGRRGCLAGAWDGSAGIGVVLTRNGRFGLAVHRARRLALSLPYAPRTSCHQV